MKRIFRAVEVCVKFISKFRARWTKQILNGDQIEDIVASMEFGDVLLVRAGGYLSSLFFGFTGFSHSAMYVGNRMITDAKSEGVSVNFALNSLVGYTRAAVMRPKLTPEELEKVHQKLLDIIELDALDNIDYNFALVNMEIRQDGAPDKLTCSQYIRVLHNAGREGFMELRKRMFFFMSVAPQDYYDARSKYTLVKEYK